MPRAWMIAVVALLGAMVGCGGDGSASPEPTTTTAAVAAPQDCGPVEPAPEPSDAAAPARPPPVVALTDLGVSLAAPTAIVAVPGSDDLFVAERSGTIRRLVADGAGFVLEPEPVLDLQADVGLAEGELGLLGLAVSAPGDRLFVDRTEASTGDLVVEAVDLVDGEPVPASRSEILHLESPCGAHYGGGLVTDGDGNLLIGLGNGGGVGDPADRGQDTQDLFGSILRITPQPGEDPPYTVPEGNPFVGGAEGAPEILVYGLRNPWRFDLDRDTGDLWVADVGENAVEELTRLPSEGIAGANLGWDFQEGTAPFEDVEEAPADLVDPQFEYTHDNGCSITGGVVADAAALPGLGGAFLFGDLCSGIIQAARPGPGGSVEVDDLGVTVPAVVTFGHDRSGRVYVASLGGTVFRIDPLP